MIAAYAVQANAAIFTCAVSSGRLPTIWTRRLLNWKKPVCWATTCLAPIIPCACIPIWAQGPTSAARKPPCWNRWKANWASRACARLSRQWRVCMPSPTVINNVETLTNVPPIIAQRRGLVPTIGHRKKPRCKDFQLSGCVNKPGQLRTAAGHHLSRIDLYPWAVVFLKGARSKPSCRPALLPALIVADDKALDTPMDYESGAGTGRPLGSASVIVMDDTVNMAWLVEQNRPFLQA